MATPITFSDIPTFVSFIVGVVSLVTSFVMGGFSIWLSKHFKMEADKANVESGKLLGEMRVQLAEIRAETRAIVSFYQNDMHAWNEGARGLVFSPHGQSAGTVTSALGGTNAAQQVITGGTVEGSTGGGSEVR